MTDSSVRVAVRIRPQTQNEVFDMCHVCTSVSQGEPQVWLGKDKAFTFDHVFNMSTAQDTVYSSCIQELIDGCFKGYNATVLAYGQTGSGKTYTMGTGFDVIMSEEETGIIPRAVNQLFSEIAKIQNEAQNQKLSPPEFKVVAQFMELYNEEIIDLLDPGREEDKSKRSCVKIHEDCDGQINAAGLTCRCVSSASEALQCLKIGALSRTTASTKMNVQSSRSHAIFTLRVQQQRLVNFQPSEGCEEMEGLQDFDTLTSKLHFVDLAGSERLKRTGATGERAREGISINCGLLALGNVISALGDKTKRATHVPYRDSKLTRLLQDSLGGNSQTLMIACVSPSDRDFMETLNTLKYANRAKNIQNKISINQDKSTQIISVLRREIEQLKLELLEYHQGKRIIGQDGEEHVNDMFHENMILESENNHLRSRLKALQETLDHQTKRVTDLLAEKATGTWIVSGEKASQSDMTEIIKGYMKEIEELRVKLMEAEEIGAQLRKQITQKNQMRLSNTQSPLLHNFDYLDSTKSPFELLREAKQDVKKQSKLAKTFIKEKPDNNDNKVELKDEEDSEEKNDSLGDATNAVNGDTDDEADDDEDSEDSDSEENNVAEGCDLAQLTQDISMKQQLIEALEESQQRMKIMRQNYEEKLQLLVVKIKDTELERDRVISSLSGNKENKSEERVKKAKEEYSSKLTSLQSELKKMQGIKKEHVQAMRNQAQSECKIQQLKSEVIEMKKAKVQLITKMKDENKHHLQAQKQSNSEIAQLKKQSRLKENKIRNLEAEKKLKENILKRKQEEIFALRKSNKPMSDQVAGRVARLKDNDFIVRRNFASPKMAKSKWHSLEKTINQLVMKKQSVCNTAKDMERYLKERDSLKKKLEHLKEKRNSAVHRKNKQEVIHDYDDNIETLNATIEYCQENISDCQTTIMQVTEAKEDIDLIDEFVSNLPIRETKYILGKVLSMAINQTFQACQKDMLVRELEAKLKESTNSNNVYLQYLERLMESGQSEVVDFLNSNEDLISGSQCSSRSSSPVDSSLSEVVNVQSKDSVKNKKYRSRKTGIPSELMADSMTQSLLEPAMSCPSVAESPEKPSASKLAWSFGPTALQQELDLNTTYILADPSEQHGMVRVTSAPTSLQDLVYGKKMEKSPMLKRRNDREKIIAEFSPKLHRKFTSNSSVIPFPSLSRQNSSETTVSDISPPNSPSSSRRQREDSNVFSRLTSGSFRLNKPGCGIILPFTSKSNNVKDAPLICTHVAEGHSRPVLSIHATDDILFSGSKDRTVKIWDLTTGKEIQSMGEHPNNVVSVKYNKYTHLAFSVSSAFIKVWDVRENPAKCLQTLYSSGSTNAGNPVLNTPSRTMWMPPGEHMINDIGLNHHGTLLFSAANNLVRLWDLRNYRTVGKLSTAHQAAIMCLAVDNDGSPNNTIVTGSKDRYIKIFEMTEGTVDTYSAKINLKPPHYDGIESLAISGDILFSSSRDRCIKKWNLKTGSHLHSLNYAHNDWIHTLNFLPNTSILLSGCRAGSLKLWSTETHQFIGGIKAHSASINAISVNSTSVFTASNDCSIGIWRLKNNSDVSPDSTDVLEL